MSLDTSPTSSNSSVDSTVNAADTDFGPAVDTLLNPLKDASNVSAAGIRLALEGVQNEQDPTQRALMLDAALQMVDILEESLADIFTADELLRFSANPDSALDLDEDDDDEDDVDDRGDHDVEQQTASPKKKVIRKTVFTPEQINAMKKTYQRCEDVVEREEAKQASLREALKLETDLAKKKEILDELDHCDTILEMHRKILREFDIFYRSRPD